MMLQDLITLSKLVMQEKEMVGKKFTFVKPQANSIAAKANTSTYYFPIVASDDHTTDEVVMLMRCAERAYAMFTRTAFQLIPAVEVDNFADATISEYLAKFHSNMGIRHDFRFELQTNSAGLPKDFNAHILNEAVTVNVNPTPGIGNPPPQGNKRGGQQDSGNTKTKLISDTDWNKANDMVPSSIMVPVKFMSKASSQSHIVDVLVNVKAEMHKASTNAVVKSIADTLAGKKTLVDLIKLISGEEKSVTDFLFGISQIKDEAISKDKVPFLDAFKRRRRLARLAAGFIKNNIMPTGTICITMNTVNILKQKYDIDIFSESNKIMDEYFLLGFMITDQTNEIVHVKFDSQAEFQQYPYKTLERENASQDRTIKDMVKAMSAFR